MLVSLGTGLPLWAQAPVIVPPAVVNAATLRPQVAPGSIAKILGQNLATAQAEAPGFPLPKELAGTRVRFSGFDPAAGAKRTFEAPLFSVSANAVELQVPAGMADLKGPFLVEVSTALGRSAPMPVDLRPVAPGILTVDGSPCGPPRVS